MVTLPPTSMSLLARIGDGDPASWRWVFDVYGPLMRAWLQPRRVQPADIDDLTQNALMVACRRLPEFRHNGRVVAFRTWLRAVVANVLREHDRASRRRPAGDDRLVADLEDSESELTRWWNAEHDRHVLRGLMQVVRTEFTESSWEAFQQTALDARPVAEVASELGMSVNAIHIARCRILARLREVASGFVNDV